MTSTYIWQFKWPNRHLYRGQTPTSEYLYKFDNISTFLRSPHPTLQWRRKSPADAPLPSTPSNENQELIIRNAQPEDSGEYECLASNDQEQNVKSTGTLTVVCKYFLFLYFHLVWCCSWLLLNFSFINEKTKNCIYFYSWCILLV